MARRVEMAVPRVRFWDRSDDQLERCAALGGVERRDRSAVRQRDLPGEAQADSAAALVGRVEGEENVLPALRIDARAIVAHLDMETAAAVAADAENDDRFARITGHAHR